MEREKESLGHVSRQSVYVYIRLSYELTDTHLNDQNSIERRCSVLGWWCWCVVCRVPSSPHIILITKYTFSPQIISLYSIYFCVWTGGRHFPCVVYLSFWRWWCKRDTNQSHTLVLRKRSFEKILKIAWLSGDTYSPTNTDAKPFQIYLCIRWYGKWHEIRIWHRGRR